MLQGKHHKIIASMVRAMFVSGQITAEQKAEMLKTAVVYLEIGSTSFARDRFLKLASE